MRDAEGAHKHQSCTNVSADDRLKEKRFFVKRTCEEMNYKSQRLYSTASNDESSVNEDFPTVKVIEVADEKKLEINSSFTLEFPRSSLQTCEIRSLHGFSHVAKFNIFPTYANFSCLTK